MPAYYQLGRLKEDDVAGIPPAALPLFVRFRPMA
jgi:hypothetical protein